MKILSIGWIFVLVVLTAAVPEYAGAQEHGTSVRQPEDFVQSTELTEKTEEQNRRDDLPIKLEAGEEDARLRVVTDSPLSPYFGAVKKRSENPEGLPISKSDKPWADYHLETGVGVRVNEQTKLNLGYRFDRTMTPFDFGGAADAEQGDINFSLEIKFPF